MSIKTLVYKPYVITWAIYKVSPYKYHKTYKVLPYKYDNKFYQPNI